MKTLSLTIFVSIALATTAAAAPSDALKTALQKGFFEEEASQNLPAAMEAYQSILRQFDEDRKIAGSAMFRLAECYRKLGQTNEAAAWYQRAIRESGDEVLKRLSQQNLAALGKAAEGAPAAPAGESEEAEEIRRYQALFKGNPDLLNALDAKNQAPLHQAVSAGREALAKFLLESGADPDRKSGNGMTALHCAANLGYKSIAETLLDFKAGIDERDGAKWTALHHAAAKGHRAVCDLLLARGADLQAVATSWGGPAGLTGIHRASRWGGSPLHLAVEHGNIRIIELLLQKGANVNSLERVTPLMVAVEAGSLRIIRLLLDAKADPNIFQESEGRSALYNATAGRQEAIMEELLKRGANADLATRHGETPLFVALDTPSRVRLLLKHGANPNAILNFSGTDRGETPLDRALARMINERSADRYYQESIELLKAAGARTFGAIRGNSTGMWPWPGAQSRPENGDILFLGEVKASAHKMEPGQQASLFEILIGKIGLTPEADLGRVVVNRIDPATGQNTNILVNLNAVKNGDRAKDIELQPGDRVTVKKGFF